MKTQLPSKINSLEEGKNFLKELYLNGEMYHVEDDAHNIVWPENSKPTTEELDRLNELMSQLWEFDEDPCDYQCKLLGISMPN